MASKTQAAIIGATIAVACCTLGGAALAFLLSTAGRESIVVAYDTESRGNDATAAMQASRHGASQPATL
jgi:hypothetical protein